MQGGDLIMMVLKALNVDDDVFARFKAIAAINKVTLGEQLERFVIEEENKQQEEQKNVED